MAITGLLLFIVAACALLARTCACSVITVHLSGSACFVLSGCCAIDIRSCQIACGFRGVAGAGSILRLYLFFLRSYDGECSRTDVALSIFNGHSHRAAHLVRGAKSIEKVPVFVRLRKSCNQVSCCYGHVSAFSKSSCINKNSSSYTLLGRRQCNHYTVCSRCCVGHV